MVVFIISQWYKYHLINISVEMCSFVSIFTKETGLVWGSTPFFDWRRIIISWFCITMDYLHSWLVIHSWDWYNKLLVNDSYIIRAVVGRKNDTGGAVAIIRICVVMWLGSMRWCVLFVRTGGDECYALSWCQIFTNNTWRNNTTEDYSIDVCLCII